jgi:hypothetical protein
MLAWGQRNGAAAGAPTVRTPGASVAAAAEAAAAAAAAAAAKSAAAAAVSASTRARAPTHAAAAPVGGVGGSVSAASAGGNGAAAKAGGNGDAAASSTARTDEEGFTTVAYRRGKGVRRPERSSSPAGRPSTDASRMDEDAWEDAGGAEEQQGGGDDGFEEEEYVDDEPADSATLKARWDSEIATVRLLERQGMHASHPALRAAMAARDAAEREYKRGKVPHPVARRMGWAQARLDRARRTRDKTRAELAAFDEECLARRQRIVDKLADDQARVSKHAEALEELQMEAGAEVFSPARGGDGGKVACEKAADSLREAAPRAAAIAESLPEGSHVRSEVHLLVAELASLQAQLELAASERPPESFDIGDDASAWSESHDLPQAEDAKGGGKGAPSTPSTVARWSADGNGRWQKGKGDAGKGARVYVAASGQRHPPAPRAPADITATPPRAGGPPSAGAAAPGTAEASASTQHAPTGGRGSGGGAGGGGNGGAGDEKPSKFLRGQGPEASAEAAAAAQDAKNAIELYHQQAAGVAAGFNTPAGVQLAAQQHAQHVAQVVAAATERGVQPITRDGEDLIMLGPDDLRRWVQDNLADAGLVYW